ncbi:MAG TPA: hypothetical protein VGH16_00775 [Candidatus Binatia bacterium]|jgi:hypothetical protein
MPKKAITPAQKYIRYALLALFATAMLWGLWSGMQSITHNEELAAKRAQEFAEVLLIKQDLDGAYQMMSSKARSYVPLEQFRDIIAGYHFDGYPKTIKVVEIRPEKEMSTVYVLLRGEDGSGKVFTYQFMLNGNEKSDYSVTTVKRF